ncbi:MAG: formate dehydrogenase accessory sulfurtransferase FdhD [Methanocorpusculum sp.]|nr:formate dehydrogenase accessory sulfurtransferase FdhD [Methanocorpusculum sp.]
MSESMIVHRAGIRYRGGKVDDIDDIVVVEEKISLFLNGKKYLTMVASDDALCELGAGFFIAAGVAKKICSVRSEGKSVFVEAEDVRCVDGALESAGGFDPCGASPIAGDSTLRISPDEIFAMREALNAPMWADTGGLHCTALYHQHRQAAIFSDIGRHNTVDKAIGFMALHGLNPADCAIACTGRQPSGMVGKAANAGIPIIVSRAASTSAGIQTAEECGVTLICFTRDGRFTVYAHPERIEGLDILQNDPHTLCRHIR